MIYITKSYEVKLMLMLEYLPKDEADIRIIYPYHQFSQNELLFKQWTPTCICGYNAICILRKDLDGQLRVIGRLLPVEHPSDGLHPTHEYDVTSLVPSKFERGVEAAGGGKITLDDVKHDVANMQEKCDIIKAAIDEVQSISKADLGQVLQDLPPNQRIVELVHPFEDPPNYLLKFDRWIPTIIKGVRGISILRNERYTSPEGQAGGYIKVFSRPMRILPGNEAFESFWGSGPSYEQEMNFTPIPSCILPWYTKPVEMLRSDLVSLTIQLQLTQLAVNPRSINLGILVRLGEVVGKRETMVAVCQWVRRNEHDD